MVEILDNYEFGLFNFWLNTNEIKLIRFIKNLTFRIS